MQNCAQMKESKRAKDVLKCTNEKHCVESKFFIAWLRYLKTKLVGTTIVESKFFTA